MHTPTPFTPHVLENEIASRVQVGRRVREYLELAESILQVHVRLDLASFGSGLRARMMSA